MRVLLMSVAVIGAFLSCNDHSKYISKSDFRQTWPFTVGDGEIQCLGTGNEIVFVSKGKTYAINDAAEAAGKYEDAGAIIKDDPNYPGQKVKMDLTDIEFEGLKLCDR